MEPRIQYAQTADGVSIAFWTMGEGMPLVYVPNIPFSHIQLEWQTPECRRWYERLARKRRLLRYDARGFGLSDRHVTDFSLDAQMLDLKAVVDHLGLDRFALFASADSGMTAIAYAARHPERVSHLILWCTWARRSDVSQAPRTQTLRALLDQDWEIYTETVARVLLGWSADEQARQFAAFYRECASPQVVRSAVGAIYKFDVTAFLPQVRSPTLVLHRRQISSLDVNVVRGLASHIPDARLALLEGASPLPFLGDVEAVLRAIREFLGEEDEAERYAEPPAPGAPVTILFTDVEGSTALTQRLGDAKARELLREHERITREALRAHGGSEVKTMGDGFMASFASATRALGCAIAIQRAFAERDADVGATGRSPLHEPIRVRIGLNAGEPIAEEEDLFGTAVITAERICGKAMGGEVLAADVVRQLVAGKGFLFSDRGDVALRGFEDPVRLFEVRWRET